MRTVLSAMILLASGWAANAEVWRMREGQCGEWRSRWNVLQDESGVWSGTIEHEHVGGPCAQGNATIVQSNVRGTIVGEYFFATRQSGATFCSYFGHMQKDRATGVELCEGTPRSTFVLRFPPSDDLNLEHPQSRQQDELVEESQERVPRGGMNFEFRLGPGRQ
jgi:hypothetical protein